MKTVNVVLHASGDNQQTFSPLCLGQSFTGDINELTQRFVSWDSDIITPCARYRMVTVNLPDWMTEAQYLRTYIPLRYTVALIGEEVLSWSETMLTNAFSLSHHYQYAIGRLFRSKQTNAFTLSLKQQVTVWLQSPVPAHGTPLSARQWETFITYNKVQLFHAQQIAHSVSNSVPF